MKRKKTMKVAFAVSLTLLIVWALLGTTSTITWFHDEDSLINSLHFGAIDVNMYYRNAIGEYEDIDQSTKVFEDGILYEPGFTHVTYLKIENAGDIPFKYDLSVLPDQSATVKATGVLGNEIDLSDYMQFGLAIGDTEEEVEALVSNRDYARSIADTPFGQYSKEGGTLQPEETQYAALVIYMPEEVGNEANYRDTKPPQVALSLAAIANQLKDE